MAEMAVSVKATQLCVNPAMSAVRRAPRVRCIKGCSRKLLRNAGYTRCMDREARLRDICAEYGLLSIYLFGSRAEDGGRRFRGQSVDGAGSDLDGGVFGGGGVVAAARLGALLVALEDLFAPLRVDLVPLDRVDPLFQFAAIQGERIAASDSTSADEKELDVMRRAADLLPFQRQLEMEEFGVSTS